MSFLLLQNVSFRYNGAHSCALQDITLNVKPSDFMYLIGPTGSGKTSLIKIMKPSIMPEGTLEGTVELNGHSWTDAPLCEQAARIGYVAQNPHSQIVCDKVCDELAFGLENLGYAPSIIRMRVAEIATYFGMQTWMETNTWMLSGGQKQLLNLASAMTLQPDLLLLDEPVSQLDPVAASSFLNALRRLNRDFGTAVVITDHKLDDSLSFSDRVCILEHGNIVATGSAQDIVRNTTISETALFSILPSPSCIFFDVEFSSNNQDSCRNPRTNDALCTIPLTVCEGRKWLRDRVQSMPPTHTAFPVKHLDNTLLKPAVSIKDVWFGYGGNSERQTSLDSFVLKHLSCVIPKGSIFAFLGGNGSGKSTLLKCICGMLNPQRGKIKLLGEYASVKHGRFGKSHDQKEVQHISMLPQDPTCLFAKETVWQELSEMSDDENLIDKTIRQLGLDVALQADPYHLSGGQQQKLAIAKVLLAGADIIVMDEPTKGMDIASKKSFAACLQQLIKTGKTVILASHDLEFCANHVEICAMLFDGSIVSMDYSREFFSENAFYTTDASRMARGIFDNVATVSDVVELCLS